MVKSGKGHREHHKLGGTKLERRFFIKGAGSLTVLNRVLPDVDFARNTHMLYDCRNTGGFLEATLL